MHTFHERLESLVERLEPTDLKIWLLEGFSSPSPVAKMPFLEGRFQPEFDLAAQANRMRIPLHEKLKAATAHALNEWLVETHRFECMVRLAGLAANLRSSQSVDELRVIIDRHFLRRELTEFEKQILSQLLFALSAFIPNETTLELLEDLYKKEELYKDFTGQLYLYLCYCKPQRLGGYTPRFLDFIADFDIVPRPFMKRLVNRVGLSEILQHAHEIIPAERATFLSYLCFEPWSPAIVHVFHRGEVVVRERKTSDARAKLYFVENDTLIQALTRLFEQDLRRSEPSPTAFAKAAFHPQENE